MSGAIVARPTRRRYPVERLAFALAALLLLVGCDRSVDGSLPTPPGSSAPPSSIDRPTPTGGGFCFDRDYAVDSARIVIDGQLPWRQVAAFIAASRKIIQADAVSAPSALAAHKVRQLALTLRTLELSVRGSVENYPDDYSSQTWAGAIPDIVAEVSRTNDCPS